MEKPGEACGIVGIYSGEPSRVDDAVMALWTLQHRGQTGSGLAVFDTERPWVIKDNGLVDDVMSESAVRTLRYCSESPVVVGHDRYSTSGKTSAGENARLAQPIQAQNHNFVLSHNGHIEDIGRISQQLGYDVSACESDSEALACLLDQVMDQRGDLIDAILAVLPSLDGAASIVLGEQNRLIAFRDKRGFRPLSIGKRGEEYMFASETHTFDTLGFEHVRDVLPGEVVWVDEGGLGSERATVDVPESFCLFEKIYFAHPNSNMNGHNIYKLREQLGEVLGAEHYVDADMVIGVQNSGAPYARGYARKTGIPEELALTKNGYINRTFILDTNLSRQQAVRMKHQPNKQLIAGKRVVLVDDSIVRGTTMKTLVEILRVAGATEVHVRIPSPPYAWPCFYGMDTRNTSSLIAFQKSIKAIEQVLGCDSLEYLGLDQVLSIADREYKAHQFGAKYVGPFCTACMTGIYPIPLHETK